MRNRLVAGLVLAVLLAGCGKSKPVDDTAGAAIKVLSNRADLVSGDDALVEIALPPGGDVGALRVRLNGNDVTGAFGRDAEGRVIGLVTGLRLGRNELVAALGDARSRATLTNHPNGGPIFAGPQPQPWTCRNGAAVDAQCNQPAEYSFLYKSSDPTRPGLQPYDPANPPTDVAPTTTDQGITVPFIVRRELGYQDRDQYLILQLFQPGQPWTARAPQPQWNRKLLIAHGGNCGADYASDSAPLDDYSGTLPLLPGVEQSYIVALGRGFAVASTALDNLGHNCNLVTAAESLIMVKERLVEQYGPLRYTIGTGCSGGSITQHTVANAYPGIYQGLLPTCSYADVYTTAVQFAEDHMLRLYFEDPSKWGAGIVWSPTQFGSVEGHLSHVNAVTSDEAFFTRVTDPDNPECVGIETGSGPDKLYNADTNPGGVRCGVTDYMINVLGPRAPEVWSPVEQALGRGFAGLPVDNVGVQYGLQALRQGVITPDQFVDLNEKIGGLDIDIEPMAQRTVADQPALANAYRSGAINEGTFLNRVAIIDGRGADPGAAHDSQHTFSLRARLHRVHGGHGNQAIWQGPVPLIGDARYAINGLIAMDRWLAAVEADRSRKPLPQKILDNRPADIGDACYDGLGNKLADGLCPSAAVPGYETPFTVGVVPVYGTPRMVAGEGIATDTNKCQLKPLDRNDDYGVAGLSDAQWARLQAVFPDGVCDFSKPGVGLQPTIPWLSYQDASGAVVYGGQPLPAAPANSGGGWASPAFDAFGVLP